MQEIQHIRFSHADDLGMDAIFRYLLECYKPKGLMPFIGGYERTFYGNEKLFDYKVIVILIEE